MSSDKETQTLMDLLKKAEQENQKFINDIDRQIDEADLQYAQVLINNSQNSKAPVKK